MKLSLCNSRKYQGLEKCRYSLQGWLIRCDISYHKIEDLILVHMSVSHFVRILVNEFIDISIKFLFLRSSGLQVLTENYFTQIQPQNIVFHLSIASIQRFLPLPNTLTFSFQGWNIKDLPPTLSHVSHDIYIYVYKPIFLHYYLIFTLQMFAQVS